MSGEPNNRWVGLMWLVVGLGLAGTVTGFAILKHRRDEWKRQEELDRKEEEEKMKIELEKIQQQKLLLIQQEEKNAKNMQRYQEFLKRQYAEEDEETLHLDSTNGQEKKGEKEEEDEYVFDKRDRRETIEYTIDSEGTIIIKGGTIIKLIEKLTDESGKGTVITGGFLLTYRSFTTPLELLDLLRKRYQVPNHSLNQEYQKHIRLRVWGVLKYWIENFFFDFEEEEQLLDQLENFINQMIQDNSKLGSQLSSILQKKKCGKDSNGKQVLASNPPPSLLPSNNSTDSLQLLEIHPQEIARQMTLAEYKLFEQIQPKECLDQSWSKNGSLKAPNIVALINRFNATSRWIASEIVSELDITKRAQLITHFIQIANECRKLQNFNSMMGILSGLMGAPVSRLKSTWDQVPSSISNIFKEEYSNLFSKNFKLMRDAVKQSNPPCLPYLGTYLADLTFIEDGNSNTIANGKLINFEKRLMISKVISDLRVYQQRRFALHEVPFIRDFIESCLEGKIVRLFSDDECYNQSLVREPRTKS